MDLLFERFLSEERGEWPDIDLDLPSGARREHVIQHVYEKYGRLGAAMTANVISYRGRSAAREVGKVLGLDAESVERLSKRMHHFEYGEYDEDARSSTGRERSASDVSGWAQDIPSSRLGRQIREAGFDVTHPTIRLFADLWRRIQHLPRHLGQHSGGMVICKGRLDEVVPLENASMPGRVVVQWDKDDCADLGIVKVDLLGLGMMAVLQDALEIINGVHAAAPEGIKESAEPQHDEGLACETLGRVQGSLSFKRGPVIDLACLPPDDPEVYRMLQTADTIGVFQVESRAQMATLPRLKPACFYDIVVEVALIRPGPIVGQMVHPYIRRRQGVEPVVYPHPSLEPILKRTLGVPLFQEQLLRIAMVAAGFSGGEAEELRRAFGFKRSVERMKKIEAKLMAGMARQGITGEAAGTILRSIASFALYGFPESHAASFALIVYASAYLKAHYPAAFYAAMLNNFPMGFYHPATLVKDAQRRGVVFAPVDVERSRWDCAVEPDGRVRLGLRYVAGLREEVGRMIEKGGSGAGRSHVRRPAPSAQRPKRCPKCGSDDPSMLEAVHVAGAVRGFCNVCAHEWSDAGVRRLRFSSLDDLINRTGLRRDEVSTLAEAGALEAFGYDRRSALWQVERAVRQAGELFEGLEEVEAGLRQRQSPLRPMTPLERVAADYAGTGLTIGPHPMSFRRRELALRGILRAIDLPRGRHNRRVRVAGAVITRQRPGTAKGFVFLTLEDETGIANVIVRPDLFTKERLTIVGEPYLLVEGTLQIQEGVTSIKAERVRPLDRGEAPGIDSHDFH
jgi:error-prone DNA polymerase